MAYGTSFAFARDFDSHSLSQFTQGSGWMDHGATAVEGNRRPWDFSLLARLALTAMAICWCAARCEAADCAPAAAFWKQAATEHFAICCPAEMDAQAVGQQCEKLRTELSRKWLGDAGATKAWTARLLCRVSSFGRKLPPQKWAKEDGARWVHR